MLFSEYRYRISVILITEARIILDFPLTSHIYHRSNLANFLIPNIPKPVLWSSQVGESYGTMEGPRIKNSTFSKFQ